METTENGARNAQREIKKTPLRDLQKKVSRFFLRRIRYYTLPALVIVGSVVAGGLSAKANVLGFIEHLGAGMLAVMLVTFGIERPFKNHLDQLACFSAQRFNSEIGVAYERVQILDIWVWTLFLSEKEREGFEKAIKRAVREGIQVQILVVDPNCDAALERAAELTVTDEFSGKTAVEIQRAMCACVKWLNNLRELNNVSAWQADGVISKDLLEIRMCDVRPEISIYSVDDMAYWHDFEKDKLSLRELQFKTRKNDGVIDFLRRYYRKLWDRPGTINIQNWKDKL